MNAMTPLTFHRFPNLPAEIRLMIWKIAADVHRIVTVDHNYETGAEVTRSLVQEDIPALLGVCAESRQLALKKYQSVFKPQPLKYAWVYTGSPKSFDLRQILKSLGLVQRGTIVTMPKVIAEYMNDHADEAEKFKNFGVLREADPDVISPQWYCPKDDVLFVKAPEIYWRYTDKLWSPWRREARHVRNVAFELDRFIRVHNTSYGSKRCWNNRILRKINSSNPAIRFDRFSKGVLESVTLLLLEDVEVITIRLDTTGLLKPDEWSYSLDLASQDFKEQMGVWWSGVTWRVTLGSKEGDGLWDRAATWKPNNQLWEQDKREIIAAKEEVALLWHIAERSGSFQPVAGRTATLVPNGDGSTYLGPSM